ncbi:MAG: response regulator [Ktedonobacterales bacterium]
MGHLRRSVVVVDDENDILRILAEILQADGYEPVTFWNAARAYDYIVHQRPALVVTDLLMPGMNGQQLVTRIREQCDPDLPIVVMSASVNMAAVGGLPIQAFLSKPFDLDDFLGLVEKLLKVPQQYIPQAAGSRREPLRLGELSPYTVRGE